MHVLRLGHLAPLLCLAAVLGCGGSKSPSSSISSPTPTPQIATLTGNWTLTATSKTATVIPVGVYLTSTGSGFSGIAHVFSNCYQLADDVQINGTIDKNNVLSAVSLPVNNQVLSFTGTLSSDGASISQGTYAVAGGCAGGDAGTITGQQLAPLTGTYAGTVTSITGQKVQISATLAQSGPDLHGFFHESGSATFTGSPCFSSATIANPASDTLSVAGEFDLGMTIDSSTSIQVQGSYDTAAKQVPITYSVSGGLCDADSGSGTLTKQ